MQQFPSTHRLSSPVRPLTQTRRVYHRQAILYSILRLLFTAGRVQCTSIPQHSAQHPTCPSTTRTTATNTSSCECQPTTPPSSATLPHTLTSPLHFSVYLHPSYPLSSPAYPPTLWSHHAWHLPVYHSHRPPKV
jgi:hypothetical protein